jgi:hypothetical protein
MARARFIGNIFHGWQQFCREAVPIVEARSRSAATSRHCSAAAARWCPVKNPTGGISGLPFVGIGSAVDR